MPLRATGLNPFWPVTSSYQCLAIPADMEQVCSLVIHPHKCHQETKMFVFGCCLYQYELKKLLGTIPLA